MASPSLPSTIAVAVVGLGAMGGTLAARLFDSGFVVYGYDISSVAVQRLQQHFAQSGETSASSTQGSCATTDLGAAITSADVVITNLPNDEILMGVVHGPLAGVLRAEQVFVEMSTVLPKTMLAVAQLLEDKVAQVVDAPVSGGPPEAKLGKLSLLVGITERDGFRLSDSARSVLEALGTINMVGGLGAGKSLKLVNNMISMANTAIAMEALQLGKSLGLEYQTMYDVLCKSGGASTMLAKRGAYVLEDDFNARFEVSLAEKDTRLALRLAQSLHFPTPLLANVHQQYESAIAKGLGKEDICALIKLYRH